jgi:hypothetical protein
MAQFNDFLDHVNVVVPGVARPIVKPVLRHIIGQFCEDSRIWYVDLKPYVPVGDEVIDIAELAAGEFEFLEGNLLDVLAITLDGKKVEQNAYQRIARKGIQWNGTPPDSGSLVFTVCLKPSADCSELPDKLLNDWSLDIAQGVAWRLMMQPNKDWSDIKLAQYYKDAFERSVNTATFEVNNQRDGNQGGKKYSFW